MYISDGSLEVDSIYGIQEITIRSSNSVDVDALVFQSEPYERIWAVPDYYETPNY